MVIKGPYKTWEGAKVALNEPQEFKFHSAYVRPNPNKEEGGYVVVFETKSYWLTSSAFGVGCPRGRR